MERAAPQSTLSSGDPAGSPVAPVSTIAAFERVASLGRGQFADVVLAKRRGNGKLYALKMFNKGSPATQHARAEKDILTTTGQHPFLVSLHHVLNLPDGRVALALDYCPGGELFTYLQRVGKLETEYVRLYTAEIVLALEHLHTLRIVYCDLKPENVLIDGQGAGTILSLLVTAGNLTSQSYPRWLTGHLKLADFGLAKRLPNGPLQNCLSAAADADAPVDGEHCKLFDVCGTPEYMAPEVLQSHGYDTSADMWSLGVLTCEMLTGQHPFYSVTQVRPASPACPEAFVRFGASFAATCRTLVTDDVCVLWARMGFVAAE